MLDTLCDLMTGYNARWWVAGGWAIDLYLNEKSRAHADVDIAVLREDQDRLYSHIAKWRPHKIVGGNMLPWQTGERLELPIHEIWAYPGAERLEFLLNESQADHWLFRRDLAVSMPLSKVTHRSSAGVPFLCPEVVLLFKAKRPSSRDQQDFARIRPKLQSEACEWLASALDICHPRHEWRTVLA